MKKDTDVFVPRDEDRLLLVSIEKGLKDRPDLLDATRYAWPVNLQRVKKVNLILGCVKGVVKGVFVADEWLDASPGEETEKNFPGFKATHTTKPQRFGFKGNKADRTSESHYLGKRVPENLTIGQNGFRYSDDQAP
jgi:uncharacterized protein